MSATAIEAPIETRLEVVSAIIVRDGRLLLQQRHPLRDHAMKWETPGGKVEHGEGTNRALQRELREELGVDCLVGDFVAAWSFDPPVTAVPLRIKFYRVDIVDQEPRCMDAMGLGWFDRGAVLSLDMTPGTAAIRRKLAALCSIRGNQ